jgi:NTE family protein
MTESLSEAEETFPGFKRDLTLLQSRAPRTPAVGEGVVPLRAARPLPRPDRRHLNLALQGGGAHGAFTWGVLDALLDDPHLEFEGLTGSSAGAMNAVVFANGWMLGGTDGGRAGARRALAEFWGAVGKQMPVNIMNHSASQGFSHSAASQWLAEYVSHFSPAQLNPMSLDPLRDLLAQQIDFEQLQRNSPFKLFIGATQTNTGRLRVFREHELSLDVLMASSCLPKINRPVVIDGEPYWDGGYSANPPISPLFFKCESSDVLLVLLNPLQRGTAPQTAKEIDTRVEEMAFNTNFMREMQLLTETAEYMGADTPGTGKIAERMQKMRFHMIDTSDVASLTRAETKMLAHGPFLRQLHAEGRERAVAWLANDRGHVGRQSSVDLQTTFA